MKRIGYILTMIFCLAFSDKSIGQDFLFDAQNYDFSADAQVNLDGKWQFYYGDFLLSSALDVLQEQSYIEVPLAWNDVLWKGSPLSGQGIATYRLKVKLDKPYNELALKIPEQATAYKIYINDKLIGEVGKVGKSKEETSPETKPLILAFSVQESEFDLIFHIANFHHKKGGMWDSITLGKKETLILQRSKNIYYDTFLAGAILIIALYHLGIFILHKEDLSAFYFFLLAFFAVIRVLATGEMFIIHLFPSISWDFRLSLEHIPFYILIGLGAMYSNTLYPKEFRKSVVTAMFLFSCSLSVTNLLAPAIFHSYLIFPFEIMIVLQLLYLGFGMFKVVIRGRNGGLPYCLGFVIIFVTAINDILYSNNVIDTTYLTPFGIFLFFFFQAFVLSTKSAATVRQVEKLSHKLKASNEELEQKVIARTQVIENKNNELEKAYSELKVSAGQLERNARELRKINEDLESAKLQLEVAFKKEKASRTELEKTITQLKAAQAQLVQSEKMVSLGQLTAGIAHEINNPMNFIYAGVEVLKALIEDAVEVIRKYGELDDAPLSEFERIVTEVKFLKEELEFSSMQEDLKHVLGDIMQGAERTIEIINGLRNFSRTDDLDMDTIDIHSCINSTLVILKNQYKNRINIHLDYDDDVPFIHGNSGQINQVFMNLLVNAMQAIEGQGDIFISTKTLNGSKMAVTIRDTGKGIESHVLGKIFDPFFTTKPVGEGTGLGLSISHGIIEKHKGNMKVTSEVGSGTEFIIELPTTMNVT